MPEQHSTGTPDDATNDLVAQITARVVAAMREEGGATKSAAPSPPNPPTPMPSPSEMADQARQTASGVVGAVQQQAVSRLDKQKEHAAEELASVAGTVREMGEQLKQPEHGAVAQYAAHYGDVAADQLQQVSAYLRQHDVKQLVREVENFARREPLLFSGGAFVLGLIGARFLKSKPLPAETPMPATGGTSTAPLSWPVDADAPATPVSIPTPDISVSNSGGDEAERPVFVSLGDDGADSDLPGDEQVIDDDLLAGVTTPAHPFAEVEPATDGS